MDALTISQFSICIEPEIDTLEKKIELIPHDFLELRHLKLIQYKAALLPPSDRLTHIQETLEARIRQIFVSWIETPRMQIPPEFTILIHCDNILRSKFPHDKRIQELFAIKIYALGCFNKSLESESLEDRSILKYNLREHLTSNKEEIISELSIDSFWRGIIPKIFNDIILSLKS